MGNDLNKMVTRHTDEKKKIETEYCRKVRALRTQVSSIHKIIAINAFAITVVKYSLGVIKWTNEEIKPGLEWTQKQVKS